MLDIRASFKAVAIVAAAALASQASAHELESKTVPLGAVAAGGTKVITHTCSHHRFAVSGGFDVDYGNKSVVVTASEPADTRTWSIELTNTSGRPLGVNEMSGTISVLCGYRHH